MEKYCAQLRSNYLGPMGNPSPIVFYVDQSKLAFKLFRAGIDNRIYKRSDCRSYDADQKMLGLAKANHIQFVSPIESLCNDQGCLIYISAE